MQHSLDVKKLPNRLLAVLASIVVCFPAFSFAKEEFSPTLYILHVDGSSLKQLTNQPDWEFGSPQWSPDGRRIAADAWLADAFEKQGFSATHLFVMNADGSDHTDLGLGAMPSWSPDGKQLVCHTYVPTNSIVVMNADGTGREKVADHWGSPRWFPTGNQIVTLSQGGLASLNLATGMESSLRIPRIYTPRLGFSCSPDGQKICFAEREIKGLAIAYLDKTLKCQKVQRRATNLIECQHSSWSPDGKQVVFSGKESEEKKAQLYVLAIASEEPPVRLPGQDEKAGNYSPDWSPDGKRIVFSSIVEK